MEGFLTLAFLGVLAVLVWLVFAFVADMATARGQNPTLWVMVSIFWTPFGSMFVLWLFCPVVKGKEE